MVNDVMVNNAPHENGGLTEILLQQLHYIFSLKY
jgi:hypothetical protein